MEEYKITLKNEKLNSYNRISWFILLILTLVYSYLAFFNGDQSHLGKKAALIIALAAAMILKVVFERTAYRFGVSVFFYILILGLIANEYYWMAGIALFFDILHSISTREKIVTLSKEKVRYPSFPARNINWGSLYNVLLKDGLLTIDSKNDKIIQQLIDTKNATINEKEFNDFCREQLRNSSPGNNKPDIGGALEGLGDFISSIT